MTFTYIVSLQIHLKLPISLPLIHPSLGCNLSRSLEINEICCAVSDGRSLLLSACLVESTEARLLERDVLASRVREVEEENRQIRLQLSQSQGLAAQPAEGNYGNQQWVASADTGPEDVENTAEERANHSECSRSPTAEKCEVRWNIHPVRCENKSVEEHTAACMRQQNIK